MECEYFKKSKIKEFDEILFETEFWRILLAPDQRNLGTCVVILKRDEIELSALKDVEWSDFSSIVKKMEYSVKKAFHATLFNWGCLMNSSYSKNPPSPQIHWHFIPRYQDPIVFNKETFTDPCFGKSTMHNRGPSLELSEDMKEKIKSKILEYL